jgi:hypothetical protein
LAQRLATLLPNYYMVTKYRPNSNLLLGFLVLIAILAVGSNPPNSWPLKDFQVLYLTTGIVIAGVIYANHRFFTYFAIMTTPSAKYLISRQGLLERRCPIDSILQVEDNKWVVPMLLIKYKDNDKYGSFTLTLTAYTTEVAAKLLNDLVTINPHIALDERARKVLSGGAR